VSEAQRAGLAPAGPARPAGKPRGHILQPYRITFAAGAGYTTDPISHPGEEFAHVLFGDVILHLGDEHHRLSTGTAIRFNSDLPHSFANANQHSVAAVVGAGTPPW
jgi:quercetin dioxygenase-like cupin family protein